MPGCDCSSWKSIEVVKKENNELISQHTATHCNTLQHTVTHCNTHGCRWAQQQYSVHEQDLPPRVKWATPTNEILSRLRTFGLGPFRSNVPFGKSFSRSSLLVASCSRLDREKDFPKGTFDLKGLNKTFLFLTRSRLWALLTWRAAADFVCGRCISPTNMLEEIELPAKLLDNFIWSNQSNINPMWIFSKLVTSPINKGIKDRLYIYMCAVTHSHVCRDSNL